MKIGNLKEYCSMTQTDQLATNKTLMESERSSGDKKCQRCDNDLLSVLSCGKLHLTSSNY